jgi:hypothetical protein
MTPNLRSRARRAEQLNFWLIVITTLTTLAYVAFCFWLA